jgi:hypothetical protein
MDKLKLITTESPSSDYIPYIINEDDKPVLAYRTGNEVRVLDKGGSERVSLVKCSDIKKILDDYMFKGTKYIVSTYNPTLYYLFPGISDNDSLFTSDNNFIPTLPISSGLVRLETDGFDPNYEVTQDEVRCMKYCDSWLNDLSKYKELERLIDTRINSIFDYYKDYDITKEVSDTVGSYSVDLSEMPLVVSLISGTTYTDTINIEDWVLESKKGTSSISGKLDISYQYSIGGQIFSGMQTIKAFQYEENVTSKNTILGIRSSSPIQVEYMNYVLKIYPLEERVDEVVFTDCTLTIGVL